jgi:antitoxin PrlF
MSDSKLTSKNQATIPKEVRELLKVKAGDRIKFEVLNDGKVVLLKLQPFDKAYTKAVESTLSEWDSPEDDDAYKDL